MPAVWWHVQTPDAKPVDLRCSPMQARGTAGARTEAAGRMRRAAKIDRNQPEIVAALIAAGCSVHSLAAVGSGMPDLLVGRQGANFLLEVKDSAKPPSARKLTPDQVEWHAAYRGRVTVVHSIAEAFHAVGL